MRTFQICSSDGSSTSHWLRTRLIPVGGASQLYVEIRFTIMECGTLRSHSHTHTCKETFNVYYYQSDDDSGTLTDPAWMENPYTKVHTHKLNSYYDDCVVMTELTVYSVADQYSTEETQLSVYSVYGCLTVYDCVHYNCLNILISICLW